MVKRLILCLITFILVIIVSIDAQERVISFSNDSVYIRFEGIDNWEFKPIQVGKKFGFNPANATAPWTIIAPSGDIEILGLFDNLCRFINGLAPVKKDGLWGIVDTKGTYILEPSNIKIWSPDNNPEPGQVIPRFFPNGISQDDYEKLIEVNQLDDWTNGFQPGIFPLWQNGQWFLIASSGIQLNAKGFARLLPISHNRILFMAEEKWGYLDPNGNQIIANRFQEARSFSDCLAAVCMDNLWGYIDITGNLAIPFQFDEAKPFASGTAIVAVKNRYGLINKKGDYQIKPEFSSLLPTNNPDLFFAFDEWKAGIIHRTKGIIIPTNYSYLELGHDEVIVATKGKEQGLFDYNGKNLIPMTKNSLEVRGKFILVSSQEEFASVMTYRQGKLIQIGRVQKDFSNGLARFQAEDGKWGFMNRKLEQVIPAANSWVTGFRHGEAAVDGPDGIVIIDLNGQTISNPKTTSFVYETKGLQIVNFQGRKGIQNSEGFWQIRPDYLDFKVFSTGLALAKKEKDGKDLWILLTPEKSPIDFTKFDQVGDISDDLCWVKSNKKIGFLNEKGKMICPMIYDEVTKMERGIAAVKKGKLWGFINREGKQLQPHIYNKIESQGIGHFLVFEGNKSGFINSKGEYWKAEQDNFPAEELK